MTPRPPRAGLVLATADDDTQRQAFVDLVMRNPVIAEGLDRLAGVALPGWYLTAGALFQTVWNGLAERDPTAGIRDYDVFYFDDTDLSYAAEDAAIRAVEDAWAGLPGRVETRNEARVHLWYGEKFGVPAVRFTSTEDAVDHFAATACCLAVRLEPDGERRVYTPHGFSDLFAGIIRPNPVLAPRHVYETKAARWQAEWPWLTVLPWPG